MYLLKEAIARAIHLPEIESETMLITAVAGLFFNLIQMSILHQGEGHYHLGGDDDDDGEEGHGHAHEGGSHDHGHGHSSKPKEADANINVSAAYCHALSDMIMSIVLLLPQPSSILSQNGESPTQFAPSFSLSLFASPSFQSP
jgi:Co/Zn/Cd efflux system component